MKATFSGWSYLDSSVNLVISFRKTGWIVWLPNVCQRNKWFMVRDSIRDVVLGPPAVAAKSLQLCLTLCDPIDGSPPAPPSWDSPGKNTGVGWHFLLQCMKVKSESEVAQSCPTPSDPMDCSPPGSSIHGIFQARTLEWGAIAFSGFLVLEVFIYHSSLFCVNLFCASPQLVSCIFPLMTA